VTEGSGSQVSETEKQGTPNVALSNASP